MRCTKIRRANVSVVLPYCLFCVTENEEGLEKVEKLIIDENILAPQRLQYKSIGDPNILFAFSN